MKKLKWNLETLTSVSVLQTGIVQNMRKIIEVCDLISSNDFTNEDNVVDQQHLEGLAHNMGVLKKNLGTLCGFEIQLKSGEVFHKFDEYISGLNLMASLLNGNVNDLMDVHFNSVSGFRNIILNIRNYATGIERLIHAFTVEMRSWEVA